jgi:hypothetical protein
MLSSPAAAAATDTPREPAVWAYRKPIAMPSLTRPTFVELRLDPDVLRDASPTLTDLRIRDAHGAEVPYAVRHPARPAPEPTREAMLLDPVATPDGGVRFLLDAGAARFAHNRLRLRIGDQVRSFRAPVRVEASEDRRGWQVLREAGFIYRIESGTRLAETAVAYPTSTARWLRVTVGAEKKRSLPFSGAALALAAAPPEEERLAATIVGRDEETMRRTTRVVVDVRARRPVERIDLDVSEPAFRRVVLIEVSDDRRTWRPAGSAGVSAVEAPGVRERLTTVRFPETVARYVRLTIQNLDDPPLTITSARAFAAKRTVVFEAAPGSAYVLDYGNPSAAAPRHDERALAALRGSRLPAATLASAQRVPTLPPSPWPGSPPLATWASLTTALVVLGSLLWRLARACAPLSDRRS